ncbi:hypothetical protein [Thiomicrospira microaerophila]|uniref:hypothetical protein n=1 Tax=Thiomicrospira microaerophila TaxID=406020 RepID=UPI0005C9662F|nr:hypothetical protein [Thiomicrospira microaerophila]
MFAPLHSKFFALSFVMLLGVFNQAWSFSTEIEQRYYLGDGDSRVAAREMLLNQIKQLAASQAGSYIQADQTLDASGRYTETITALSASLVKVHPMSEVFGTDTKGIFLTMKARVEVDESELRHRIRAMQADQSKAKALNSLQTENQALTQELKRLQTALANRALTLEQANNLTRQQSEVYQKIERNQAAAQSVFSQGTLFSMAQQNANREQEVRDQFAQSYQRSWQNFSRQLKPKVHSVNGNEVIVAIKNFRPTQSMSNLVTGLSGPDHFNRSGSFGRKEYTLGAFQIKRLADSAQQRIKAISPYIASNPVFLELELAGVKNSAQIFGFFTAGHMSGDPYTPNSSVDLAKFNDSIFGNGFTKDSIGFINRESFRNTAWYIQDDTIFFRFNLNQQQMNSADRIEARYRF